MMTIYLPLSSEDKCTHLIIVHYQETISYLKIRLQNKFMKVSSIENQMQIISLSIMIMINLKLKLQAEQQPKVLAKGLAKGLLLCITFLVCFYANW